jgi:hypothetical protein
MIACSHAPNNFGLPELYLVIARQKRNFVVFYIHFKSTTLPRVPNCTKHHQMALSWPIFANTHHALLLPALKAKSAAPLLMKILKTFQKLPKKSRHLSVPSLTAPHKLCL